MNTACVNVEVCGRFLRLAQPTGTQRSARLLLNAVARYLPAGGVSVYKSGYACLDEDSFVVTRSAMNYNRAQLDHLWEQIVFPMRSSGTILSLIGTGPVFHPRARHVMIVHDINYILIPSAFTLAFRLWYRVAVSLAARRADRIVCFTNYVKDSLVKRLGVSAGKIDVIPQGPGLTGLGQVAQEPVVESEKPYFLCVGSLQPHKNLKTVLQAWRKFRIQHPHYRLVVVGRKQAGFSSTDFSKNSEKSENVEFTGYVSDSDLIGLYKKAHGFFFPSLEEGFGLPVVEAFYCGCPVVTSNVSCLPEVNGGAGILVSPLSVDEVADAMHSLARNPSLRQNLRALGFARAQNFTWDNAGRMLAAIIAKMEKEKR